VIGSVGLILFAAAQGFAVFVTAAVALHLLKTRHWFAKTVAMGVSLVLWCAFTLWLLFWGADSYILFFGLVTSAALSSAIYWLLWMLAPTLRGGIRSGAVKEAVR
jgi:Na+/melibiose symporter-like transporter